MRAKAILGIFGAFFGVIGAIFVVVFGGIGEALELEGSKYIASGMVALILSIIGLIGGIIKNNTYSGILMLIAGIGGFIAVFMAYIIAAPCFIIGGIMALIEGHRDKKKRLAMEKVSTFEAVNTFEPIEKTENLENEEALTSLKLR